jgi:peptidoglycan/xylan/chitin deacetylase (PgdA/CDA1 family)
VTILESATKRVAASFRRRPRNSYAVPVLCYHALHARGTSYAENDHTALEEDLRVISRAGFRILPLPALVDTLTGMSTVELAESRFVCITFDDGPDVDYMDYSDSRLGLVKSFRRILAESRLHCARAGDGPMAVSFVIASRGARTLLDRSCIAGRGDWRDSWWSECSRDGTIAIGNHSWDHLHESLPSVEQRDQLKGSFFGVDNPRDADIQIRVSREAIEHVLGHASTRLFAYPYGEAPDYLVRDYFPRQQLRHGHRAAFTTGGAPATREANRWCVPRYVCGSHWSTPDELERLLQSTVARSVHEVGAQIRAG